MKRSSGVMSGERRCHCQGEGIPSIFSFLNSVQKAEAAALRDSSSFDLDDGMAQKSSRASNENAGVEFGFIDWVGCYEMLSGLAPICSQSSRNKGSRSSS